MAEDLPRSLRTDVLRGLLHRLNAAMAEAKRLRDQITRQLDEQRASQQQRLSPVRRKRAGRAKR